MSVGDRLGRLLFIVPYVANQDGVALRELADKLQVKPKQIEADLQLLSMVGQPPLTPDHLIDLYIEDEVVYVDLDQSLSRPLRLTHEEARNLVLAIKLVGNLGGVGERLESVLNRIIEALNPEEQRVVQSLSERVGVWQDGAEPALAMGVLRRAIEVHEEIDIVYYSASSDRQKNYRLRPIALIQHSGIAYLVAQDRDAELREKVFRLDRLAEVETTGRAFDPPSAVELAKYRTPKLYFGTEGFEAVVRFSAEVAPQVRERFSDRDVTDEDDGSVTVRLNTSSSAWLARWVLPFGLEAEVVHPPPQRDSLGRLCREAALAYRRPPFEIALK